MIKNIIYVEDGSVDLDELESTLTTETKIIVYRQGSTPPTLVQPKVPINDIFSEAEFTDRNTIAPNEPDEDLGFLVANAIINNLTAEETAEYLYKHNYRKQSETVKEFAEQLKKELFANCVILKTISNPQKEDMDSEEAFQIINELVEQFGKEEK